MVRYEIDPARTALLIIDMTNDFVGPNAPYDVPEGRAMIPRLANLLETCRRCSVMTVFTTQAHRPGGADLGRVRDLHPLTSAGNALRDGTHGTAVHASVQPLAGEALITKRRYSAFFATDLEILLRNRGVDTLIIAGVATSMCCESTVRDAFYRDYRIIFLSDGTATHDLPDQGWGPIPAREIQRHVLSTIAFGFGEVATIADVIARISLGAAGIVGGDGALTTPSFH